MGKKDKYNWKKKRNFDTEIDNSETLKIKVDLDLTKEKYDDCNQLVLPSKKRPTKKHQESIKTKKLLSKSKRKKLEKIIDRKKKKADRSSLLEALAQVQAPLEELNQLASVASVQTRGLKKHFADVKNSDGSNSIVQIQSKSKHTKFNTIVGSKRKKKFTLTQQKKIKTSESDYNIVGFESSSESENEESSPESESKESEKEHINGIHNEEMSKIKSEKEDEEGRRKADKSNVTNQSNSSEHPEEKEVGKQCDATNKNSFEKEINSSENSNLPSTTAVKQEPTDKPKRTIFVPVYRDPQVEVDRMKLPILAEEQMIMEAINENDIVIIAGETGSGKTTQVPQFLFEAGYASAGKIIGITQPRRIAAIAMSKRVANEMNLDTNIVSYLIRFEGNVSENTKIKFMTDGVLLKEIQSDFTLSNYSVILLDEAHERNVYTDILIGLLSRIVPLRKKQGCPLKLIIMSATLRVEDFTENPRLFKVKPPVIKVDSRQFPVTTYFNKRTSDNYLKDCFLKTCKIHTQLPPGGILVFVTGQREVNYLVRKLRKTFPLKKDEKIDESDSNLSKILKSAKSSKKAKNISSIDIKLLDKYSITPQDDGEQDLLEDDNDLDEICDDFELSLDVLKSSTTQPLWVLPMYSLLPSSEQAKVFQSPPEGCRMCVVSTNVAETSLTIPNIKYVVDSGKTKVKLYDKTTGVTKFVITWCSKASANQRAGRAGRLGPGYCYRLFSSAVFNDEFPQFSVPEIHQKPIDDLILQMKAMNIIKVLNFPFPTAPDLVQLKSGEKRLKILGALHESSGKEEWSARITELGETMAAFPVSPRFAKMLALGYQYNLLQYIICIVAALSVNEVFINAEGNNKCYKSWAGTGNSFLLGDIMVLLRAVGAAEYSKKNLEEFCLKNGLRHKAICEIRKLRVQLTNQINLNVPDLNLMVDPNLKPPTDTEAKLLRQVVLSGFIDHVARKVDSNDIKDDEEKRKWKKAYRDSELESPVFLHSSSVLKTNMPEWVAYQEIYETNKLYMRGVIAIEPEWLPKFASSLCNLSEPLEEPPPKFDSGSGKIVFNVYGTYGKAALAFPTMEVPLTNYKWFAKFFLEGEVFPKLKQYVKSLLSAPSVMTKSWARLQPRTQIFLSALMTRQASTREDVSNIWKNEPFYLLEAYKAWLPESAHESVSLIWPPV